MHHGYWLLWYKQSTFVLSDIAPLGYGVWGGALHAPPPPPPLMWPVPAFCCCQAGIALMRAQVHSQSSMSRSSSVCPSPQHYYMEVKHRVTVVVHIIMRSFENMIYRCFVFIGLFVRPTIAPGRTVWFINETKCCVVDQWHQRVAR